MKYFSRVTKTSIYSILSLSMGIVASLGQQAQAAGSATTVYRLYNTASRQHLQTLDANEASVLPQNPVWKLETATFSALPQTMSSVCATGTEAVYRLVNRTTGEHFLTADANEYAYWTAPNRFSFYSEGTAFCVYSSPATGLVAVNRLFNQITGEHFLTANSGETSYLLGHGWSSEGTAFYTTP